VGGSGNNTRGKIKRVEPAGDASAVDEVFKAHISTKPHCSHIDTRENQENNKKTMTRNCGFVGALGGSVKKPLRGGLNQSVCIGLLMMRRKIILFKKCHAHHFRYENSVLK
jgi:hypothetical protein